VDEGWGRESGIAGYIWPSLDTLGQAGLRFTVGAHVHEGHVDEHVVAAGKMNPAACTPSHKCSEHEASHTHGAKCGHEAVPHADHVDYVVGGHLHHAHDKHCDDHGVLQLARS